jgi:hypothetical protein
MGTLVSKHTQAPDRRQPPLEEAERWLSRHRAFWRDTLARLDDVLLDLNRSRDGK